MDTLIAAVTDILSFPGIIAENSFKAAVLLFEVAANWLSLASYLASITLTLLCIMTAKHFLGLQEGQFGRTAWKVTTILSIGVVILCVLGMPGHAIIFLLGYIIGLMDPSSTWVPARVQKPQPPQVLQPPPQKSRQDQQQGQTPCRRDEKYFAQVMESYIGNKLWPIVRQRCLSRTAASKVTRILLKEPEIDLLYALGRHSLGDERLMHQMVLHAIKTYEVWDNDYN
ncbi:hypothetical protein F4779DRAFT_618921 [Xylariaceae sp. FL0662B]|nr:hypothetical protein F4779DRAFT_618921 [Xylariaceae sp. FL0662B]